MSSIRLTLAAMALAIAATCSYSSVATAKDCCPPLPANSRRSASRILVILALARKKFAFAFLAAVRTAKFRASSIAARACSAAKS